MTLASKILLASIPFLINLYATRYREQDRLQAFPKDPDDLNLPVKETFDFIIVGGGTAGMVVARRLSDEQFSVLVLESGGVAPPLQSVPLLLLYTKDLPDINYLYRTVPQKNAALNNNGILYPTTGKMLGGSSSHNNMLYERGHPETFNDFARISGDSSWRYENIVQYFLKSENYMGEFNMNGKHSVGGPMTITQPKYSPGQQVWLEAGRELGFEVRDPNGPQTVGVSPTEFWQKFGRRVTTYSGYIQPIERQQKTLTIRRYAVATKIVFEGKTAVGVLYNHHGVPRFCEASKEVILSAGTYRTPLLLFNSGVGPIDQLESINVKPIAVLPVGFNLLEHPFLDVSPIFVKDASKSWKIDRNLTFSDFSYYLERGDGPLTSSYGMAEIHLATSRAKVIEQRPEYPDAQILYQFNQVDDSKKSSVVCHTSVTRPYSKGRLTMNTSVLDPDGNYGAILDFNFFEQESDFDVMIEAIDVCLKMVETTEAFKKIGAKFTKNPIKGCQNEKFRSRAYWKCFIRQGTTLYYHSSGTCKMGKPEDPNSVVDSKLKVIGLKNLRIVDGSIMPILPNTNVAASVIMIAEKASSEIIQEYRKKK